MIFSMCVLHDPNCVQFRLFVSRHTLFFGNKYRYLLTAFQRNIQAVVIQPIEVLHQSRFARALHTGNANQCSFIHQGSNLYLAHRTHQFPSHPGCVLHIVVFPGVIVFRGTVLNTACQTIHQRHDRQASVSQLIQFRKGDQLFLFIAHFNVSIHRSAILLWKIYPAAVPAQDTLQQQPL